MQAAAAAAVSAVAVLPDAAAAASLCNLILISLPSLLHARTHALTWSRLPETASVEEETSLWQLHRGHRYLNHYFLYDFVHNCARILHREKGEKEEKGT